MTSIGDPHLAAAAAAAVHPDGTVGGFGFGGAGHTVVVGSGGVALPAGTVTFLLTDVEGSTVLWETRRAEMGAAIARHYDILDEVIGVCGGVRPVEQGEGDSVVAAFAAASDALAAALQAQRRLQTELGWIPVRMAVHSGEAQLRGEGNYVGRAIIRCARLRACGHGGQVLVSAATAALIAEDLPAGAGLADLGTVRLRGLSRPERVWQLTHPDLAGDFAPLRSLQATPHNVPVATSSFIGRDAELGALGELLRHERLVTLTGSGGSGKTRLALRLSGELLGTFVGGVWWVELAPATSDAQVADRVATAVGLAPSASGDPLVPVVTHLRTQGPVLLVIDNAEHLIDAVALVAEAILSGCPEAHVLITSREPLGVAGEYVWRVPSLRAPRNGEHVTLARLEGYEAVRLFLERARQARPNLVIDERSVPHLSAICTRLDGIPLALELAAARVRTLPLDRLAAGLDDAFRLLTGGSRTALPRQQTLLASIAWSVDLLDDTQRAVLRRLAVFHGSFTLDGAEAVAADGRWRGQARRGPDSRGVGRGERPTHTARGIPSARSGGQ